MIPFVSHYSLFSTLHNIYRPLCDALNNLSEISHWIYWFQYTLSNFVINSLCVICSTLWHSFKFWPNRFWHVNIIYNWNSIFLFIKLKIIVISDLLLFSFKLVIQVAFNLNSKCCYENSKYWLGTISQTSPTTLDTTSSRWNKKKDVLDENWISKISTTPFVRLKTLSKHTLSIIITRQKVIRLQTYIIR